MIRSIDTPARAVRGAAHVALLTLAVAACQSTGHAHKGDDATVHHRFDDVEKWSAVFDNPERDAWQKPAELVAALGIAKGQAVADIGAGTGYFNPHLAAAVGPTGTVIAIDIEPTLVEHMRTRAAQTPQVEARLTKPDSHGLNAREVDWVLLVDTYHHINDRTAYFGELRAALRPGGSLVVVDFKKEGEIPVGPPPAHRIAHAQVTRELAAAGWTQDRTLDLLPYQYVGVYTATPVGARSDIDVAELARRIEGGGVVLLDVRSPGEYAGGHVPGARNVPLGELASVELDAEQPVLLICASGRRSSNAADQLVERGLTAVNVLGGTNAWRKAGHPVEH